MKKKILITAVICVCVISIAIPLIVAAQGNQTPKVQVNKDTIDAEDVDLAYKMSNFTNAANGGRKRSRTTVMEELITQKILNVMFIKYNVVLPTDQMDVIENSFKEFDANYEKALAGGSQSEIDYMNRLKQVLDNAQKITELSKEEFEAYNIEQSKFILKRSILLKESFGGDVAALEDAVKEIIANGEVEIKTANGQPYQFKVQLGDIK